MDWIRSEWVWWGEVDVQVEIVLEIELESEFKGEVQ